MPLSFGNRIPRPSSLPIPRHVSELVPPPYVPKELSTPSPVKPRMLFKPNRALQVQCQNKQTSPNDNSDDGRASSLSPAMAPKRGVAKIIPKTKPMTGKDNKFVRSLNHNIQHSNILYQETGFAKPVAPATSVCRVSKAQTSKVAATSNLKRRPGLASNRRQADDKTPSTAKQGGRPPTSRDENRAPPPHPRLLRGQQPQEGVQVSQQPDLVKFSASKSAQHAEIDRLENLLDAKNKDLEKVRNIVKENALGFDVMAVVLNQMSIKTCLTSHLQNMVAQLSKEIEVANLQIATKDEAHKDLEERHSKELLNFQSSMQLLKNEHENNQRELNEKHQNEMGKLKENTQTVIHEKKLKHEEDIAKLMNKHKEEMISLEQSHTEMIESLKSKFTDQEAKLRSNFSDEKSSLDERISELNAKIKTLEDNLMHGSDYRLKTAQNKMTNLQQEIDSLKTVVEMRTSEVHELRAEKVKLEEKLELFDQQQISIKKFTAQVEDLKEQLTAKCDIEQKIMEENRNLHHLVQRENFEKKRLSMENEQLSWKMNQGKEYNMLNTSEDSSYLTCLDGPLSMSYCEGTTCSLPVMGSPRFTRGGRPMSAPPGKLAQTIFDDSRSLPPDSPRVLEVVEKSESVSWKLEYDASMISADSSPSPTTKRKLSPQSPLMLRKCKSSGLMTRSLDMSLGRSNSYTSGTDHTSLCRTQSLIQRNGSIRRKIIPSFETLSESTESESDDSKKNSPVDFNDKKGTSKQKGSCDEINNQRIEMTTPAPVDIAGSDDEMCEISSSSEIEIGEEQDIFNQQDESSESEPGSPDTEPEVTLRSDLSTCTVLNKSVGVTRTMNTSLPSYDLARLFHYSPPTTKESAGEALIEETFSSRDISSESETSEGQRLMTDSLSTVSWDEWDQQAADDDDPC